MTFLEAAIEVLRREGKPLPTQKLAELALKQNLLSVIGRDPSATMQTRLEDALGKDGYHAQLMLVRPGVYGLRVYPPRDEVVQVEASDSPSAPTQDADAPAKPGRRRRRGKGTKAEAAAATAAAETESAAATAPDVDADADADAETETDPDADTDAVAADAKGEDGKPAKRARRRRGGRGRRRRGAGDAAATDATAKSADTDSDDDEENAPAPEAVSAADADDDGIENIEEVDDIDDIEFDTPSGAIAAPMSGDEDFYRSDEDRTVRSEILGRSGEDRGRGRRRRGPAREGRSDERIRVKDPGIAAPKSGGKPDRKRAVEAPSASAQVQKGAPIASAQIAHAPGANAKSLSEILFAAMKSLEGRPSTARQIADVAVKKGVRVDAGDIASATRLVRVMLQRESKDREIGEGLRSRLRGFGGGQYGIGDRRVEQECAQAEREVSERVERLRETTRAALRRRLPQLSASAFETLCRVLLDRLGVENVEPVRKVEGVTYLGGTVMRGAAERRVLVAVRWGGTEIQRRAVGELRAGLAAKGYDEGILFAAGKPGADGLAELKTSPMVTFYDGQELARLCARHGVGVRKLAMPVEYLDVEWLADLAE